MPSCCQTDTRSEGTNEFFSKWSKKYAKRFRKGKLEKVQKQLLEGVRRESLAKREILDIGCGVGSLHLTLLDEGAARATGVDISEGMLEQAKKFSEQKNLGARTSYILGDFVQKAGEIEQADITLLDKVVCCYDDVESLIKTSAEKTRRLYAFSHPRQSFLMKALFKTQIAVCNLFRSSFRPYWHDWSWVRGLVVAQGFELIYENATIAWQVAVYKRR
jgi:2-polyprenyl-3-methyl-5-hydroxy-6-metoxy-1,4-benzoquinol methylase